MIYKHISGTDLNVSAVCLGTTGFGENLSETESHRQMDRFFDQGGNILDTARIYSDWMPGEKGRSERIIGDYLAKRKTRDRWLITTKGGHPLFSAMDISRLSPRELLGDIDDSLQALRTDHIDLYYLHRDNTELDAAEIIGWMNEFVAMGKIRYFGCSNWKTQRIREAQRYAHVSGLMGFCANQPLWNVACYTMIPPADPTMIVMDKEMIQFHGQTGLPALPYSSQAGGFFSKLDKGDNPAQKTTLQSPYASSTNLALFSAIKHLTKKYETPITHIVLGYLLSQRFAVIPVFSSVSIAQLDDTISASNTVLSESEIRWLDSLNGSGFNNDS
jgi:aryl-alcohol dehydrogenase-like predicted oxidoreductase